MISFIMAMFIAIPFDVSCTEKWTKIKPSKISRILNGIGQEQVVLAMNLGSPDEITDLICPSNELSCIPRVNELVSLRTLNISNNSITSLEWIKYLPQLFSLEAEKNRIVSLDPLTNNKMLKKIMLDTNDITDITPILTCEHIEEFSVHGNPLDLEPLEKNIEIFKKRPMTQHLAKIIAALLICDYNLAHSSMQKNYTQKVCFLLEFREEDQRRLRAIDQEWKKFKELGNI